MRLPSAGQLTPVIVAGAFAAATVAWIPPTPAPPEADTEAATCQFIIKGSNRHSFDVFVDFYDSTVRKSGWGIMAKNKSLYLNGGRVQDRRIPRGESMEQRVQADGGCEATRYWTYKVRIGSNSSQQIISKKTRTSKDRTIDLGASNTWTK